MSAQSTWLRPLMAGVLLLVPVSAFAAESAVQGITLANQSADQWRASKLIGVPIYGPDNKRIGKIADLLMDRDGKSQDVIVGVGGFLGIGEKDVAIPFAAVEFSKEPIAPQQTAAPANNMAATPDATAGGTANGGTAPAPDAGLGTSADTLGNPSAPAMGTMPSTAYPDHGTIAFTVDQLKSAPAFHFAK